MIFWLWFTDTFFFTVKHTNDTCHWEDKWKTITEKPKHRALK